MSSTIVHEYGLKKSLKGIIDSSFEYLFGALPYDIFKTRHSQYCTECDQMSDAQLSMIPLSDFVTPYS